MLWTIEMPENNIVIYYRTPDGHVKCSFFQLPLLLSVLSSYIFHHGDDDDSIKCRSHV